MATAVARLFAELVAGAPKDGAFILNSGDAGLLRSLEKLSAAEASECADGGATIAAHTQHVRYGLSLMNDWAQNGGDPFADAKWDEAWKISTVTEAEWSEIRAGLREEAVRWEKTLDGPAPTDKLGQLGFISSVAHVAYHLGAIRQISKATRGPKEGTFPPRPPR
jgi:hypothetical protein